MDDLDLSNLPTGYERIVDKTGRVAYLTPFPRVKIRSIRQLNEYHAEGRYLSLTESFVSFNAKQKNRVFTNVDIRPDTSEVEGEEPMEQEPGENVTDNEHVFSLDFSEENDMDSSNLAEDVLSFEKQRKLEKERIKLKETVERLKILPSNDLDHKAKFRDMTMKLDNLRKKTFAARSDHFDPADIKILIKDLVNPDDILAALCSIPEMKMKIFQTMYSDLLEQLLGMNSNPMNPLKEFPFDLNSNLYCKILEFALTEASDVLLLLLSLTVKNENPIDEKDVISLSYLFSTLAAAVCRSNNSLKKTKTASAKLNGMTNTGVDDLAKAGIFETSRSFSNDRDFLASVSEELMKSYARQSIPQITFDNMDIKISHVLHHLTLSFLEFETVDTSELPAEEKSSEEALDMFKLDTVLLRRSEY